MKQWKGKLMATTVAAAVLIGGFGGLATHQAFADDDSSDTSESQTVTQTLPVKKQVAMELKAIVPAAASLLNLSSEALNSELKNGKSLTEIAAQRGFRATEVKEQLAKTMFEPIDQALSEQSISSKEAEKLKQKITDQLQRAFSTAGYQDQESAGNEKSSTIRFGYKEKLDTLANMLGLTKKELKKAIDEDGKSIAEIAASKGISEEQLIAKLKDEMTPAIQDFINKK